MILGPGIYSPIKVKDLDTGGGTDSQGVVGLVYAASGGAVTVSATNPLPVDIGTASVTINASDIEIGAVELKDGTTDNRASISAAGALKVDGSAVTQPVSLAALVGLKDSTGADLSLLAGGVYGLKVHVVGDSDKYVRGNIAHDAIDSASDPVNIGGTAATTAPTAVAVGDRVRSWFDTQGRLHITGDASATAMPVSATDLDIRDLASATDSVSVLQATHDNLNLNANLQVGNADVSLTNPVPVQPPTAGYLTVAIDQTGTRNDVDVASLTVAAGATSIAENEDAAHTTGDRGVKVWGVRNDGGNVRSDTNGDYEPIPVASLGSLAGVPVHVMGDSIKYVQSNLADGSALNSTTQDSFAIAGRNTSGNKTSIDSATTIPVATAVGLVTRQVGLPAATAVSDTISNPTTTNIMGMNMIYNGSTWSRAKQASQTDNVAGTGVPANAIYGVFDDTSPTAITENQFGALRMSSRKFLYTEGGEANDVAIASNPVRVAGRASTTAPTAVSAANDVRDNWVDLNGRQAVFESVSFSNITLAAPTTTVVKSGAGVLSKLTINTPAANGVITIYDNTAASGTKIATITQPATLLSSGPVTLHYEAAFATGLTIVTSGAAQDITVSYL